jgi:hypothetical protein
MIKLERNGGKRTRNKLIPFKKTSPIDHKHGGPEHVS